ncbi:MAG TPA: hypothetical protein EYP10_00850, partial [Armatimonadetes bacterium]|nr:hypothetical protein [Armatimonadota bacterium]
MKIDDVILWLTLSMLMLFTSDVRGQVTTRRGLGAKSRFGIDYVFPLNTMYQRDVFPRTYAQTKVGWVNFARVSWHRIEPTAPVGRVHNYRWEMLDRSVRLWQRHGFRIAMSLRLENGWFAGPIRYRPKMKGLLFELLVQGSDRLPASEHMDAYRAWIRALVERYDGDGKDDMPGLRYPILHYQVGNEYANPVFWSGTLEDYKVLLRETLRAGRSACPHVKIISQGIRWGDLFHDDPEARLFEERFSAFLQRLPSDSWREGWKRAREFTEGTVALARLYDILDAGGNGPHHTASFGYMQWVKRELKKHGLSVAIWDMEARCEPRLVFNPLVHFHRELVIPNGAKVLRLLRAKRHLLHRRAVAWYRAEQARILVKVFVTRFAAGFEKVFMGMASDWTGTLGEFSTANPFIGLLDTQGKPWPAFYALQLLVDKIDGFARAEKMHSPQDVELYRFTFDDGRPEAWVGWLKEMKVRGMGDPLPVKRVRLAGVRGPVVIWTT